MEKAHGWSADIKMNGGERQIALEVGGQMLWLDADGARRLAGALESKADELEGLAPTA
jgi:hypothetical protein